MRSRPSFAERVERRIFNLEQKVKSDKQRLRDQWIEKLDILFEMATSAALPEVSGPDKTKPTDSKERQMWAHVAAHVGMVMGNLAKGYDDRQFDEDLAELERLADEINKLQNPNDTKDSRSEEAKPANANSSS